MSWLISPLLLTVQSNRCPGDITVSSSLQMKSGNRYIVNSTSLITLTLPRQACKGESIFIEDIGTGRFRIAQLDNQQIQIGEYTTSYGLTGRIDSIEEGTSLELLCVIPNFGWLIRDINCNISVV